MIVLRSLRPGAALYRHLGSPEGCGRLTGDDIPGNRLNNPCALKGRWERIHFSCPFVPSVPLSLPKAFQGFPNLSKVFQAFPRHFQKKKDCLFFMNHLPKPILVEGACVLDCGSPLPLLNLKSPYPFWTSIHGLIPSS